MTPSLLRPPSRLRSSPAGISALASKPAAAFPLRVATDDDLLIAQNRISTTLAQGITAIDTNIIVVDPTGIALDQVLSLDRDGEIVKVMGPAVGKAFPVARGFDGTPPVAHGVGAAVVGNIVAWHHNAMSTEVMAIENFLGVNGNNLGTIKTIATYDFPAQSPGGSLVVGNNTITLSPVPLGVNGSDANHYLYISGGTGAAEAVLITGGNAVAGAASGTLTFTCANTHSGAWQIRTATAGMQEAIVSLGAGGGSVLVPTGLHPVYATTTISVSGIRIQGAGNLNTQITTSMTSGPVFRTLGALSFTTIIDLQLTGPNTGSNFAITLADQAWPLIQNMSISQFGQGISVTGSTQLGTFRNIVMNYITGDGAYVNTTVDGGTWDQVVVGGVGVGSSTAFHVMAAVGIRFNNVYANAVGQGLYLSPASGQTIGVVVMENISLDGFTAASSTGIRISPAAGGTVNTVTASLGGASGFNYGMLMDGAGTVQDLNFTGITFFGNKIVGISMNTAGLTMSNISFTDCFVENSSSGTPGVNPGVSIQYATNVVIQGGVYAAGSYANGINTQSYGIAIGGGTTNCVIKDAILTPNVTGSIVVAGSNPGLIIRDCMGYNPVGVSTITVGASPFTYTAGHSRETVYIQGGTITQITRGGQVIANTTPPTGQSIITTLPANAAIVVTYSAAPTMWRDVQ
jgi:hypothetical protein